MRALDLSVPLHLTLALIPDLVLMGGAMLLLLWAAWRPDSDRHQRHVGLACIVLAAITMVVVFQFAGRYDVGPGPIAYDNFRWDMDIVILLGTIFTIALSIDDNRRTGIAAAARSIIPDDANRTSTCDSAARDLMIVFLGIELMSISVYALSGINRRSVRSAEGALKYFLLGAFSTAFLLYGIALVYGATGSTSLTLIGGRINVLGLTGSPLLAAGIGLMLIGFGFKVATVPFHMWAPDVYDGAPSPITAYMAATVKAAAFAAFIRVWLEAFPVSFQTWHPAVSGLAVATMVVGNAIGLAQRNIKRLLAYSSIGHAGYLLVAVAAGTFQGSSALLFYLFVYTLATFGAFAVIVVLTRESDPAGPVMVDDFAGLWSVRPWLALSMGVLMLALLGFPVFGGAGFFAKWYILQAALQASQPQTMLAVVLVLTTVVSAGYYLYVVMVMFMRARTSDAPVPAASGWLTRTVLVTSVVAILALGILPDYFFRIARAGRPRAEVMPVTTQLPSRTAVSPAALAGSPLPAPTR